MNSGEITLADLAKKIDEQARFTRSVSIICTLAILGVMFYTLTEIFANMPSVVVAQYMANLDSIVSEWDKIEQNNGRRLNMGRKTDKPKSGAATLAPDTTTAPKVEKVEKVETTK